MVFDLKAALQQRRDQHRYRNRLVMESPVGRSVIVEGQPLLNFCSNDYLGLAAHEKVVAAFRQAADEYGVGSGASHLVCGHSHYHHQLEERLADFVQRPRALLFSSGYMANVGTINALLGKDDAVFEDRLNHASLLDGGLSSGARFRRYPHNDVDALRGQLKKSTARRKLVVADAVFSMDGDQAPLQSLQKSCDEQDAWLMVDDAHGFGVLGETGAGTVQAQQANPQVLMATLGKAIGTSGAFVAGSEELIETLIQFSRTYVYTTAMPPAVAAATIASLEVVQDENERREKLQQHIQYFRSSVKQMGYALMDSATPIQPLLVGEDETAIQLSARLREKGVLVSAIRPPTVPEGSARLRITLSAAHQQADLDQLLAVLAECAPKNAPA